ncbi:aminotransferase [Actinoplanes sp. TBRC 11911]|uniref:aminotransferase class IV n=1 Tax=Actinoplanes sp. TBRC 11911 TaxID=2729386 RepID=UPI00145F0987|nr:aminotransferase class IV [Actinoplanes sp. TBRC 11911]NMO51961.1 aminotransferase [Actinoplanes sp. TBRC 11911]
MVSRLLVSPEELFGDGVFETVHVRPSGPWLLAEHLARLRRSAELLDIPVPADVADRVAEAVAPGLSDFSEISEMALRIMLTRESLHVAVSPIPGAALRERRTGIRVISASIGHELGRRPPWSLSGAKVLSYGSNFAARRWARHQGADDLLWLSDEGYALEAPTASLVWLADGELCTVPAGEADILPGTTARELLSAAASVGLESGERMITLAELRDASAIWFASSLRGLAEVTALDGVARPPSAWTRRLLNALGYPLAP